jgi:hypothetical protein
MSKRLLYRIWLLCVVLFIAELITYAIGSWLQQKELIHVEQKPTEKRWVKNYADYLDKRDALLGWPYPFQKGGDFFDTSGARHLPAFDNPQEFANCISLYGDSYTMSSDVAHKDAWANQLAKIVNCRVANFGVGGYGIDQAYLRYQQQPTDHANLVILGHSSIDIIRNITRLEDLYSTGQTFAFKPRFILDTAQQLQLIKIPKLSEQEYYQVLGIKHPILKLEHEVFQLDGLAGITRFHFPYLYTLFKSFHDFRLRAKLARQPPYFEFYQPRHPTQSLELATALLQAFYQATQQRQQQALIVFFANDYDLKFYQRTQQWSYQNLLNALDKLQIPYLNFGPTLLAHVGQQPVDRFFKKGHYNKQVNQWVADFIAAEIKHKRILLLKWWNHPK